MCRHACIIRSCHRSFGPNAKLHHDPYSVSDEKEQTDVRPQATCGVSSSVDASSRLFRAARQDSTMPCAPFDVSLEVLARLHHDISLHLLLAR